jgi:hypothetical protein
LTHTPGHERADDEGGDEQYGTPTGHERERLLVAVPRHGGVKERKDGEDVQDWRDESDPDRRRQNDARDCEQDHFVAAAALCDRAKAVTGAPAGRPQVLLACGIHRTCFLRGLFDHSMVLTIPLFNRSR